MRFHLQSGNLFAVRDDLVLEEVGYALASDQVSLVQRWIEDGALSRLEHAAQFEKEERFAILIVQPFVLAQKEKEKK